MHFAKRRHITGETYIYTDRLMEHEVVTELRRISGDEGFDIIYDRATTTDCALPGHHVYRVLKRAGVPSEDVMVIEFSLKEDFNKPWTPGNARKPGWWIIDHFKSRDKARMDDETLRKMESGRDIEELHEESKAAKAKETADKAQEFGKAVDTYARKGRGGAKGIGKIKRQRQKRQQESTEQKIQIAT